MLDATPFLRLYARWRNEQLRSLNPTRTQEEQLLTLVRKAANTTFGKMHGFSSISSVAEYQRRVPLRKYEDFWRDFWKSPFPVLKDCTWPGEIPFFPVSSGRELRHLLGNNEIHPLLDGDDPLKHQGWHRSTYPPRHESPKLPSYGRKELHARWQH